MVYNTALAGRAQINYAVTLHHYAASMIILVLEYVLILFFSPTGICCRTHQVQPKGSDEHAPCRVWGHRGTDSDYFVLSITEGGVATTVIGTARLLCVRLTWYRREEGKGSRYIRYRVSGIGYVCC